MRKAIKKVAMLFMVCGLVISVSFGVDLVGEEEKYEKLKAELEEYGNVGECKWSEDGKKMISESVDWRLCKMQKVLLFFDEIRAKEVKVESCKKRYWARNCYPIDKFNIAVEEVKEIPLFKSDSLVYNYRWNNSNWWKGVWSEWRDTKHELKIRGIKGEYWKAVAKESE